MENIFFKKRTTKITAIFFVIYAVIWLFPGIISYSVDSIIEYFRGFKQIDSWTYGDMWWLYTVIILPIIYLLVILFLAIQSKVINNA